MSISATTSPPPPPPPVEPVKPPKAAKPEPAQLRSDGEFDITRPPPAPAPAALPPGQGTRIDMLV